MFCGDFVCDVSHQYVATAVLNVPLLYYAMLPPPFGLVASGCTSYTVLTFCHNLLLLIICPQSVGVEKITLTGWGKLSSFFLDPHTNPSFCSTASWPGASHMNPPRESRGHIQNYVTLYRYRLVLVTSFPHGCAWSKYNTRVT